MVYIIHVMNIQGEDSDMLSRVLSSYFMVYNISFFSIILLKYNNVQLYVFYFPFVLLTITK